MHHLRAAVVKLPGLSDAQPPRAQHEGLLDDRLGWRRLGLGEVDRPAVAALGRFEEHVEQERRVGGSSLTALSPQQKERNTGKGEGKGYGKQGGNMHRQRTA